MTTEDAKKRLITYGKNELVEKEKYAVVIQFFSQFLNPLILILLFASLISAFFGEITNFVIITIVIIANNYGICWVGDIDNINAP